MWLQSRIWLSNWAHNVSIWEKYFLIHLLRLLIHIWFSDLFSTSCHTEIQCNFSSTFSFIYSFTQLAIIYPSLYLNHIYIYIYTHTHTHTHTRTYKTIYIYIYIFTVFPAYCSFLHCKISLGLIFCWSTVSLIFLIEAVRVKLFWVVADLKMSFVFESTLARNKILVSKSFTFGTLRLLLYDFSYLILMFL